MNITFHPNEFMLATAVGDRTVKFWDLESFRQVRAMRAMVSRVYYYKYHPVSLHSNYNHSTKLLLHFRKRAPRSC